MGERGLSQEAEDAIVTRLLQRLAETGHYQAFIAIASAQDRELWEACVERHAARCRAAGEPGW